jgi:hypothetical protein
MADHTQVTELTWLDAAFSAHTRDTHAQRSLFTFSGAAVAPVIGNFFPAVGATLARWTTVAFDVTDASGLLRAEVFVRIGEDLIVVHDGDKFRGRFVAKSTRAAIAEGFRYTVAPASGWSSAPVFEVHAVDATGAEVTA